MTPHLKPRKAWAVVRDDMPALFTYYIYGDRQYAAKVAKKETALYGRAFRVIPITIVPPGYTTTKKAAKKRGKK